MLFTEYNLEDDKQVSYEEGKEDGREEGREEGKEEDARNMKAKGYPVSDICEITGLTVKRIEEL